MREKASGPVPLARRAKTVPTELDAIIRAESIDFIDLGSSKGGSLKWAMEHFGGRNGLGVDKSAKKVALARAAGMNAVLGDATELACSDRAVRFTTMLHFLEHLPNAAIASQVIVEACRISREFVYMRHPWFASDGDLFRLGYKFFWSDWSGHPNHFGPLDFLKAIRAIPDVRHWYIMGRTPIRDIRHPAIVPLDAPVNSFAARPADYRKRKAVRLGPGIFTEIACLIVLGDADVPRLDGYHRLLMSSPGAPPAIFKEDWRRRLAKALGLPAVRRRS